MYIHFFWQYPLVIISCSHMLSDNGIVWFNSYNLYNFCCPRVTQLFHSPRADPQEGPLWAITFSSPSLQHNFLLALPTRGPPLRVPGGVVGEGMRTHYFWQYPLVIISCSYMLSDNVIVWFCVVRQLNCLVWCCQTIELFGLVLSDN